MCLAIFEFILIKHGEKLKVNILLIWMKTEFISSLLFRYIHLMLLEYKNPVEVNVCLLTWIYERLGKDSVKIINYITAIARDVPGMCTKLMDIQYLII